MKPNDRVILALDFSDLDMALDLADRVRDYIGMCKVGLPLLLGAGFSAIDQLRKEGHQVFLDLKFHDIPTTVEAAVRESARRCVRLVTVHAAGGPLMLRHAVGALSDMTLIPGEAPPRVLAVTLLTSIDEQQLSAVGIDSSPSEVALRMARLARDNGTDGVIASPQEAAAVREGCGRGFLIVCPGIRPAGEASGDQARVGTAAQAVRDGADYLVVGRPIRNAADPVAAARALVEEIANA
jgi:orotidine-5'-phosphate decarboxylase